MCIHFEDLAHVRPFLGPRSCVSISRTSLMCVHFQNLAHVRPPTQPRISCIFQPQLEDSGTEQQSVLSNPRQIQYKTKTTQLVVAQLQVTQSLCFMKSKIISFVQPKPNSIQNKNNPIGCGTSPGNLVLFIYPYYSTGCPKKNCAVQNATLSLSQLRFLVVPRN